MPRALSTRQIQQADPVAPLLILADDSAVLSRLARVELAPAPMPVVPDLDSLPSALPLPGDDSLYLPRRQLDQAPRALSPIDLPWPEDGPPAGHFAERVSLFIDEAGSVQRVRIDGPGLPQSLQAVVQDAFLRARFSPGLLAGQPVRSWIRLEVVFDAAATARSRGLPR
ncbi:hypothetical protein SNE35_07435 [Paucibacter sp. R3-3]|uniref:TonB C-terminal domain-containing protein n=1 Tax=Roseateles agri TaxID=3098619 RepID=A0ABU5DDH4_9BURK|nr:hypothetical protein [Paucibacter sp. R3-3]MDY0744332.1 hypothetical protein [Paucibacter sp. R3-3]